MKVGVIGLGTIAQKAYLPILAARGDLDIVLATRNSQTLDRISRQYRIPQKVGSVEELIHTGIQAAFVHAATEAHFQIVQRLLDSGIHVYVDKPLAYSLKEARDLVELAARRQCLLMVGFNRRFAPFYSQLRTVPDKSLIFMQKNRVGPPETARTFIFDDFIHVVDTLRFLSPGTPQDIRVSGHKKDGLLEQAIVEWSGPRFTAIGIMNRNSGKTEERLEVIASGNKWQVDDLVESVHSYNGEEKRVRSGDWEPILVRRGFAQIIDCFLSAIVQGLPFSLTAEDSLLTHVFCEQIVRELDAV
ncbi:gfo/Idh/MocA family oxidoreductase [Candidatus Cryosericum hinesii]|jgi:virulence factor|uniref:Gfo/Idh/MocA family oxidoreductase n=1 Tax=Candidatus Cryosericum hinesii TaxID=2290915 RepID=A0A398DKQ6_9BACT|nr:Gfo/Idh/MocA family oxidoreductase [Candidatus Cryosericum hinesii]RIE08820.1 gfo/Idh/MocA family oxidoreductase [Candidatus Cryosericum hinesii]RIE12492.1 gfo/Idh/MocA family oxidoreductase [Candidatus Cryosericum hinesii]RIE12687.1 gfo/Idh/MocA family oxidoreductase [Candidatus Cryosericum hinesii]